MPPGMAHKVELALSWPESMLKEIQAHATRTDRSVSNIVQTAWKHAAPQITAADRATLAAAIKPFGETPEDDNANKDKEKEKEPQFFPNDIAAAMEAQATRLDVPVSFVAQAAFALGKAAIVALPDFADFDDD